MKLLRLRRAADAFCAIGVSGLVLLQIDALPIKILGGLLLVIGAVGELVLTARYLVRRWGPSGSKP